MWGERQKEGEREGRRKEVWGGREKGREGTTEGERERG